MTDLTKMHPREMLRGLMRGNRTEMKLGYSAGSAALTVRDYKKLDEQTYNRLLAYALGFADGMDATLRGDRFASNMTYPDALLNDAYDEGVSDGLDENPVEIYPT